VGVTNHSKRQSGSYMTVRELYKAAFLEMGQAWVETHSDKFIQDFAAMYGLTVQVYGNTYTLRYKEFGRSTILRIEVNIPYVDSPKTPVLVKWNDDFCDNVKSMKEFQDNPEGFLNGPNGGTRVPDVDSILTGAASIPVV